MDKLGVSIAHLDSQCTDFYDHEEVERGVGRIVALYWRSSTLYQN